MIIWLTGQPGSGKTTLSNSVASILRKENDPLKIVTIDGDNLRAIWNNKDYSKEG